MKKLCLLLCLLLLLLMVSGCTADIIDFEPQKMVELDVYCDISLLQFPYQRTFALLENATQLTDYLLEKDYTLGKSFSQQAEEYSDEFFETNYLLMIASVQVGHSLALVEQKDNKIVYHTYNTDMIDAVIEVYIHFVAVSKNIITNNEQFDCLFEHHEISADDLLELEEQYG